MTNDDYKNIRGIETQGCFIKKREENYFWNEYDIYLMRKFYVSDNEPVVQIKLKDQLNTHTQRIHEYFLFDYRKFKELNDTDELEFETDDDRITNFWSLPDYCVDEENKNEEDKEKYPRKDFKLPKKYKFTIEKIVDGQTKVTAVIFDTENKLIKLRNFGSYEIIILNTEKRIQFKIDLVGCKKKFNNNYLDSLEEYNELIEIVNKFNEVDISKYIGIRECRGLDCETFHFYTDNKSFLYTFFLKYDEKTEFHQLVHVKKQSFRIENDDKELIDTIVYEVYDYQNIENEYYWKEVDLSDCACEHEHKIEIKLTGLLSKLFNNHH